jgi:hypothetical protein
MAHPLFDGPRWRKTGGRNGSSDGGWRERMSASELLLGLGRGVGGADADVDFD